MIIWYIKGFKYLPSTDTYCKYGIRFGGICYRPHNIVADTAIIADIFTKIFNMIHPIFADFQCHKPLADTDYSYDLNLDIYSICDVQYALIENFLKETRWS